MAMLVEDLIAELTHVHNFIASQSANTLAQSSQHQALIAKINRINSLTVEDSTNLNCTVSAGPWTQEEKDSLHKAVADRLSTCQGQGKKDTQTNKYVENYFTTTDTSVVGSANFSDQTKHSRIGFRMHKIGLRHPSEKTVGRIAVWFIYTSKRISNPSPDLLNQVVQDIKDAIKDIRAYTYPHAHITAYPIEPQGLSQAAYAYAYNDGDAPLGQSNTAATRSVMDRIINSAKFLRKTAKDLRPQIGSQISPTAASVNEAASFVRAMQAVQGVFNLAPSMNTPGSETEHLRAAHPQATQHVYLLINLFVCWLPLSQLAS